MQWSGAECERSERRGGLNASGASSWGCGRAKRAACGGVASEASGGGGAAGRPRIVAEGDVLRVYIYISGPLILSCCGKQMHGQTIEPRRLRFGM